MGEFENSSGGNLTLIIDSMRYPGIQYAFLICLIVFLFCGSAGNLLVLMACVWEKKLRTAPLLMISYLALVDFVICTVAIPFDIVGYFVRTSRYVCQIMAGVKPFLVVHSLHVQCIIAFTRFALITTPANQQHRRYMGKIVAGLTTSALLVDVILFAWRIPFIGKVWHYPDRNLCFSQVLDRIQWRLIILFIAVLVPIVLAFIFYMRVCHVVRKHTMTLERGRGRQVKFSKFTFLPFLVWTFGYVFIALARTIQFDTEWRDDIYRLGCCISNLTSVLNPIFYCMNSSDFKLAFKKFLGRRCCLMRSSTVVPQRNLGSATENGRDNVQPNILQELEVSVQPQRIMVQSGDRAEPSTVLVPPSRHDYIRSNMAISNLATNPSGLPTVD